MRPHLARLALTGYFCSGLNRPAEVRGVAAAGFGPGITCTCAGERLLTAVEQAVAEHGCHVFVDSGAFSEVAFGPAGVAVVAPIEHADWLKRLKTYRRLARSCGPHAHLVAPDMVGHQTETLQRLRRYRHELADIVAAGMETGGGGKPRMLIPLQRGALSMQAFAKKALAASGLVRHEDAVVWAIPAKKAATTAQAVRAFAATCRPDAAFHLLGLGHASRGFSDYVRVILEHCPRATITCDSVRISAMVGRAEEAARGEPPRLLTREQDRLREAHPDISGADVREQSLCNVLGDEAAGLMLHAGWLDIDAAAQDARAALELAKVRAGGSVRCPLGAVERLVAGMAVRQSNQGGFDF